MKRLIKIINNIPKIIFIIVIAFLLIASIFSSCDFTQNENTEYNLDNYILNILCIISVVYLIIEIKRKKIKLDDRLRKKIMIIRNCNICCMCMYLDM